MTIQQAQVIETKQNLVHFLLDSEIILDEHWSKIDYYRDIMTETGYVKFPQLMMRLASFISTGTSDLKEKMRSQDFIMPKLDSPRKMKVLNGTELSLEVPIFNTLYFHHEIRRFLSEVVSSQIHSVKHSSEFMVSNMLRGCGDTHGWHLDDPQLAFVIFVNSPSTNNGGKLEYIANWHEICSEHQLPLEENLDELVTSLKGKLQVVSDTHVTGDAYLLNAYKHLHRVTPLEDENNNRWVVNMAFDTRKEIDFGETANILYN